MIMHYFEEFYVLSNFVQHREIGDVVEVGTGSGKADSDDALGEISLPLLIALQVYTIVATYIYSS